MRIKCNRSLFILFLLILTIFSSCFSSSVAAEEMESLIGNDDTYEKNGFVGHLVHFNWTLSKNTDTNYVVIVHADDFDTWTSSISPNYFFLDEDNPREIVTLKVTIPQYPKEIEKTASIIFSIRPLNSTQTTEITRYAKITIEDLALQNQENSILGFFNNPLPSPLNSPIPTFILNIFLWILIAISLYYFIKIILINLAKKTKTSFDDRLIEIVRRPFLCIIILYGTIQSVFNLHFTIGLQIYIFRISIFIFFILGIYIIYKVYNESLEAWSEHKGGNTSMFGAVLKPILKKIGISFIIVGGLIFALNATGVEITALLAGAGIMGLVIAFAAQDTLSNFFSGIHLLLDRPFKIGDVVYMEPGNYWEVLNVGMRSTRLLSIFDHELVIMPNNTVANQKIINIVKPDSKIRKRIKVSVAYGTDLEKVSDILLEIASKHPNVMKDDGSEPIVRITDFADSGIDILLVMWIDEVMNQWLVLSDIRKEIDIRFKKEHITIPFPQRTIWLKNSELKEELTNDKQDIKKDTRENTDKKINKKKKEK